MRIAIVGEFTPGFTPHAATMAAIAHSAARLQLPVESQWLSTVDINDRAVSGFDGFWIAPGSPYKDMAKTVWLIQQARERSIPCFGTCGGFQHMVIEFARNVLGIHDAQHAEYDPYASKLMISRLACSLVGREMTISLTPASRVAAFYGTVTTTEEYYCNFAVNPEYAHLLADSEFRIVGADSEGE
ncbi:MAG: CTP synthase, partial [Planctomycetes bacterium]|nr:CTP synthase [Planctomycetota bacterium]